MIWTCVALIVTLAIQAVLSAGIYSPSVLAPSAQHDVGAAASGVGILISIAYVASTLSSLFAGLIIARLGPLRASQLCLLLCAAGMVAFACARLDAVILGALLLGAAYGPATPASSQILVARSPAHLRATILSVKQSGVPVGGALIGVALPPLILSFGWQAAALAVAAASVLLAIACEPLRSELDTGFVRPHAQRPDPFEALRLAHTHARLRELTLVGFAYSGMQMVYVSYLVIYLIEDVGFSLVGAGAAMSGFMVAGMIGRIVWGAVSDRTKRGRLLLAMLGLATGVSALVLAAITRAWPEAAVIVLCVLAGATAIGGNGVFLAEVAHNAPEGKVAAATGGAMMGCYLGAVVVPAAFWAVHAATGSYPTAFASVALLGFGAAAMLLRTVPPTARGAVLAPRPQK